MAIKIKYTNNVTADGVKSLVYGKAGIGKTHLMKTAEAPLVLSCESGLLTLRKFKIPFIEINNIGEVYEALEFVEGSKEADQYNTIAPDSISEIAEVLLSSLKEINKDGRQAYDAYNDEMAKLIRRFRDLKGKNVIFTAKRMRFTNEATGITTYVPSMPGKKMLNDMPYFFDEVFYMDKKEINEKEYRVLFTQESFEYEAKDRSDSLNAIEKPDLKNIFKKIISSEEKK